MHIFLGPNSLPQFFEVVANKISIFCGCPLTLARQPGFCGVVLLHDNGQPMLLVGLQQLLPAPFPEALVGLPLGHVDDQSDARSTGQGAPT